jgi:two-component system, cell cycle response regulator
MSPKNDQSMGIPMHGSPAPIDPAECLAALSRASQAMLEARHWYDGVDRLLAEIGRTLGVSRVWIFQLLEIEPMAVIQDYVFEWAPSAHYRQLTQRRFRFFASSLADPEYRRLVEERLAGKRHAFCVSSMAPGPLRENLESQAIRSMATVPIVVHGQWWGTLGIDDCEQAVSWEGPGLDLLTAASQLIAAALYRHQLTSRQRQIELFHKVADCGVWEVSLRNGRVWCSQALKVALGYPDTYPRLALRRLLSRVQPDDRRQLWHWLRICLANGRPQLRLDIRLRTGDGRWVWHELVAELQRDHLGQPNTLAGLILDISRRKHTEQRALAASELDALTGVLNRRGLERHLRDACQSGERLHLLLFDIDHFKQINDTYGHPVGDRLLKLLVRRIQRELRPDDALVRLGGEEFGIIVGGVDEPQAMALAERIRLRVCDRPFVLERQAGEVRLEIRLSISLGVAQQPDEARGHEDLLSLLMTRADQALYAAKRAGRNRTLHYQPDTAPL